MNLVRYRAALLRETCDAPELPQVGHRLPAAGHTTCATCSRQTTLMRTSALPRLRLHRGHQGLRRVMRSLRPPFPTRPLQSPCGASQTPGMAAFFEVWQFTCHVTLLDSRSTADLAGRARCYPLRADSNQSSLALRAFDKLGSVLRPPSLAPFLCDVGNVFAFLCSTGIEPATEGLCDLCSTQLS